MIGFGDTAFGIDVGDGTLKVVKLARGGRGIKLVRTWRLPYSLFDGDPGQAALTALDEIRPHVEDAARVVVAAPSAGAAVHTYTVPSLESSRSEELARYEVLRDVGLPVEDLLIRHRVRKGPVESRVHTFALARERVDRWTAALDARRVPYDDVQLGGVALASFIDHERPSGDDRVLLAVGSIGTELVLTSEGGLWARHLPFGLADEEDLDALALRLSGEIGAAIEHFLPSDRGFEPTEIVITEEGALQGQLITALESVTGRQVRRTSELTRIATAGRLSWDRRSPEETLAMGKAFGLALAGLGVGRFVAPMLGPNAKRDAARRMPLVAAAVLLSAMGIFTVTEQSRRHVAAINAALPVSLAGNAQDLSNSWRQIVAERDDARGQADALLDVARRRTDTFAVRRALDIASPLVSMREGARLHVDKVWLSTARAGLPGTLAVTIHADPRFDGELAAKLESAYGPAFSDVRVRGPEAAPDGTLSRFVVEVTLE